MQVLDLIRLVNRRSSPQTKKKSGASVHVTGGDFWLGLCGQLKVQALQQKLMVLLEEHAVIVHPMTSTNKILGLHRKQFWAVAAVRSQ